VSAQLDSASASILDDKSGQVWVRTLCDTVIHDYDADDQIMAGILPRLSFLRRSSQDGVVLLPFTFF
jgi:hypothetical protein